MIALVADEDFNHRILRGLLRRQADLDIVRVQDTPLSGASDADILAWAFDERRVLLTHDVSTMVTYAYERMRAGLSPLPRLSSPGRPEALAPRNP